VIVIKNTIDGFDEVLAAIERMGELPADRVEAVLMSGAAPMAADMAALARRSTEPRARDRGKPRPPGHMADSIKVRSVEEDRAGAVVVTVGPGARYYWSRFVEFGTSKMPAQPFARLAYDAGREQAAEAIQLGLITLVRELAGER
jgi:HK97 gp10 family phage protein